jgi:anti-sigma factor RsiW
MTTAAPFLVLAVLLVLLGRWGSRRSRDLVPANLPMAEREARAKVVRRGAVSAYVVAAVFVVVSVAALF